MEGITKSKLNEPANPRILWSMSSTGFDYDVAVIGGGSAGYAAARTAASAGLRIVVIEGGQKVGGLCILRGCMPTKAMLHCAEVLHQVQRAPLFGVHPKTVAFDFAAVMGRKNQLVAEFAAYRQEQLTSGQFEFIRDQAHFLDRHTIALTTGQRIRARNFVLATGSIVAPSPLPQLDRVGYWTSDGALELRTLPKSLIVLGGGSVAVEFAQFFARFGVEVIMVQRSPHLLREMDADAAGVLESVFRHEGIKLFTDTHLLDAWREDGLKHVSFQHQGAVVRVSAEEILFGLGRVPHTEPLRLEAAQVSIDLGRILTHPDMTTTAPHIYAAGDCTGLHEIVHLAVQQGEVAGHNIAHPNAPKQMDYRLLTTVVFSDPQLATVGLTEKAAVELEVRYLAAKYPFSDHGKALIMECRDGFVKLLADPITGEILGGAIAGPMGGELIHEIIAAMAKRMTVHELAAVPHYHPTLAEIWTYPAEELASQIPRQEGGDLAY
jgi:pyruvate/2-oxoglutarate dehydrogenase complex dihydrolipoamide dehydrogenase (E3) component